MITLFLSTIPLSVCAKTFILTNVVQEIIFVRPVDRVTVLEEAGAAMIPIRVMQRILLRFLFYLTMFLINTTSQGSHRSSQSLFFVSSVVFDLYIACLVKRG